MTRVNLVDKKIVISVQVILFSLTLFFVSLQSAFALSVAPDLVNSTSPSAGQSSGTSNPWHTMILSDHGKVQKIDLGIYFSDGAAGKTFQTEVSAGPGDCNTRAADGYDRTHTYLVVEVNGVISKSFTGRQVCNGTFNGWSYSIPSLQQNYGGTGIKTFGASIQIRWVNDSEAAAQLGIGATRCNNINVCPIRPNIAKQGSGAGSNVRFRVKTPVSGGKIGYINTSSSSLNSPNNSIIHGVTTPNGYEKIFYPFARPCDAAGNVSNALVTLYDADNGTSAQPAALDFYVATLNGTTVTPLTTAEYSGNGGGAATSLGDIWVNEDPAGTRNPPSVNLRSNPNGYPVFTPSNFNNQGGLTQVKILTFDKTKKYVLVADQVHANQFIYVGLPGDAIFGSPSFNCPGAEITPNAVLTNTSDPNQTTFIEPGQQFNGTASFSNGVPIAGSVSAYLVVWLDNGDQDINLLSPVAGDNITGLTPLGPQTVNVPASSPGTPMGVSRTGTADLNHEFACSRVYNVTPTFPATVTRTSDTKCVRIERRPYFQVNGGDVNAAAVFPDAATGNCSTTVPAGKGIIAGWNKGPTGGYAGASTNIAAFAAQAITDFVSYKPGAPPKGLTFASAGALNGTFDETYCIDSVVSYPTDANITVIPNSGTDTFNGNITTNGNIAIRYDVKTINGVLISKGNIYTCADNSGAPATAGNIKTLCTSTLTVNGAFIANIVYLLRSNGSVSTGPAAEVFNYSPNVWLSSILPPSIIGPGSINLGSADSETSLPPVL